MKKLLLTSIFTLLSFTTTFAQGGIACWREISAGANFTLAIKTDGTLWGWGQNGNLLGLGFFTVSQNLPIQIGTANDWMTVSAGGNHVLAVKTNGTLWAWGSGLFGQLGNGAFNNATFTVTQLGTATDWFKVSAGSQFSLALKTNGTLWSWGLNSTGQLGDGTTVNTNIPNQVGISTNWSKIEAGDQHSLAIDNTGLLYSWGNNTFGQLGDGTNATVLSPALITSFPNCSEISAGFDHSMILNTNGFLFTAGNNTSGQLCNGTSTASNVFTPGTFGGVQRIYVAISAGTAFSLAIRIDATLHSSGGNIFGQLAQGNNTPLNFLTQVGTNNNWFVISAGNTHFAALDNTTSLFSAGRDFEGQIAQGTNIFSYQTLQTVSCPTTPLSNNDLSLNPSTTVKVYPNPTNGIVNINYNIENATNIMLSVTNIQGQLISKTKLEKGSGLQTESIDLSSLSKGLYFISINSGNENYTSKVIKQ